MMSINQRIVSYMADTLELDSDNREVVAYSLELIFHTITTMFLVLLIAWVIGPVKETVVLLIVMYIFKNFAGGAHCNSALRCTILSMLLVPTFAYSSITFSQYFTLNILILLTLISILLSYVIVYNLAPVTSPAMPIVSDKYRQKRRNLSFFFLILITIVQIFLVTLVSAKATSLIVAIDIGILWQSFMLTQKGHALVNCYDRLLLRLAGKGGENNETY